MDYEKEYKEARDRAIKVIMRCRALSTEANLAVSYALSYVFPTTAEDKSEDEGIRKEIIEFIYWAESRGSVRNDWHQKKRPAEWIAYLEKQKEQKPSWTEIDKSRERVVFPFNARVKDSDKVVTIIDGQLNSDGKLWIRFASNKDDGFKVYNPEDLLVEQRAAEWSEDDKGILLECISALQNSSHWLLADKLSSLRPQHHWKPSEEQINRLGSIIVALRKDCCDDMADFLAELYHDLKKL